MIELEYEFINTKYVTSVGLIPQGKKDMRLIDLIFDTGSTMTAMSRQLFDNLGYELKNPSNIIIRGINGESKGISTIIDNFVLGGENLGNVRVALGDLHRGFEESVILGVNVLVWYNYAVLHHKKQIILEERQIKTTISRQERFIAIYPQIMNMWASIEDAEDWATYALQK